MQYVKQALTLEAQADRLLQRGLVADRRILVARLREVNYYRLSAYWHPYRLKDSEQFAPGTTLDTVWQSYTFDRRLRFLAMDAIERIEVSVRTRMVNVFTLATGPFGYLDGNLLSGISEYEHRKFIETIVRETESSKESFVQHYRKKYSKDEPLPMWMACELMSFGTMLTMYKGLDKHTQKQIAEGYGLEPKVLDSWLRTLNYVRNICAHHSRLWNRELAIRPFVPRADRQPQWHVPVDVMKSQHRTFSVFTLLKYMLDIVAPQSAWQDRLADLFAQYPYIPKRWMGFPDNWRDCPIWQRQINQA